MGKSVFKLALLGSGQVFDFSALDVRVPVILDDAFRQVISQATSATLLMSAPSPPCRSAAWRVEVLFSRFPSSVDCASCYLSLARCLTLQDPVPHKRKVSQYECGRPHDTVSSLFCTSQWLWHGQSILTQLQQTNGTDLTCCKTLPTKSVT